MADPVALGVDTLGARTWVTAGAPVVVVPLGSFEQHGPHLPLDTDTRVAVALATTVVASHPALVLGPTLTVSASGEHAGFPGTLSIGVDTTTDVLVELVRSADWATGVVIVNGHGGNAAALARAGTTLRNEGRRVLCWSPRVPGGDLHAGRTETSLMLHLAPGEVRLAAAAAGPQPALADLAAHGVRALSENGVLGDPTGATAEAGRVTFDALAADLRRAVAEWLAPA